MLPILEILQAIDSSNMHLIILPTEQCNFRCTYCYEDFAIGRMSTETIESIKFLLSCRSADLSDIKVSWFGGEPLVAQDIVLDIMNFLDRDIFNGKAISSDITTNGYRLSPDLFEELTSLRVNNYQISLDGLRNYHDKNRPLANGSGTFDRIWYNVTSTKRYSRQFTMNIRVHADRDNIGHLPEFIDEFANEFGGDDRFGLYIRHVSKLGGANDNNLNVLKHSELSTLNDLRAYATSKRIRTSKLDETSYICYAAKPNSFVIRADGTLAKCTVAFASPHNNVGRLESGGTMELDNSKLRTWAEGLRTGVQEQLVCPWNAHVRHRTTADNAKINS